ncbi:hypothetical protein HK102_010453, partial [Quaeritorhiza haematococci]
YYLTHLVHFYSLHILSSLFFLITGFLCNLELFTRTAPAVLFVVWLVWGFAQIATAFVFSTVFDKARTALVITFLLTLTGVITALAVDYIFLDTTVPLIYFIYPPFAFYRCLAVLNAAAVGGIVQDAFGKDGEGIQANPYTIAKLQPGDEVFAAVLWMAVETIVMVGVYWYLGEVMPKEFGIRKKWWFPVTEVWKWLGGKKGAEVEAEVEAAKPAAQHGSEVSMHGGEMDTGHESWSCECFQVRNDDKDSQCVYGMSFMQVTETAFSHPFISYKASPSIPIPIEDALDNPLEDADVRAERDRVYRKAYPRDPSQTPLVMRDMRKIYPSRGGLGPKVAVKGVTLAVEEGIVFGLLGPNGAGLSSLSSFLFFPFPLNPIHAPLFPFCIGFGDVLSDCVWSD